MGRMNKLINDDDDGTQEIAILFIIKQREPLLRIRKALGGGGGVDGSDSGNFGLYTEVGRWP